MLEQASVLGTGAETPLTLGGAVRKLARLFEASGLASPQLDARILVAEACGRDANGLILDRDAAISAEAAGRIASFAARHLAGEPVSRILGRRESWGLTFHITPDTLDPRPETELLVETVLGHVRAKSPEWQQRRPPHPDPLPKGRRDARMAAAAHSGVPSPRPQGGERVRELAREGQYEGGLRQSSHSAHTSMRRCASWTSEPAPAASSALSFRSCPRRGASASTARRQHSRSREIICRAWGCGIAHPSYVPIG